MEEPLEITPSIEGKNMQLEFLLFNETEKNVPYQRPAPLDKRYRGGLRMETFESLNIETMETPEGTRLEPSENLRREMPDIKNKWLYLAIPACSNCFCGTVDVFGRENTKPCGIHAVDPAWAFFFHNVRKK